MQGKGLIGGTERSEERIYPPDWPCTQCGRAFEYHCKKGIPHNNSPWLDNWCSAKITEEEKRLHRPLKFTPVDNLTYVEMKAKEVLK